jgi:fimbrial isopeptide formation D2 family protein
MSKQNVQTLLCSLFIYLLPVLTAHAQTWERLYGTPQTDDPKRLIQTRDGGYLLVGYATEMTGTKTDIRVIKTDAEGNTQWQRNYGRTNINERAYAAAQNSDGTYVIGGVRETPPEGIDGLAYLLKINALGDTIWTQSFFPNFCNDVIYNIQRLKNGSGYLLAGTRCNAQVAGLRDDIFLMKTDLSGNPVWTRTFVDTNYLEFPRQLVEANDGSIFVGGTRGLYGFSNQTSFILKTDGNGNSLWFNAFGSATVHECTGLVPNTEGGVWASGGFSTDAVTGKSYMKKLGANGVEQWGREYTGFYWSFNLFRRPNGGFALINGNIGGRQYNDLLSTDSLGNEISRKKIQGYSPTDELQSLIQTTDNGFALLSQRKIGTDAQFYLRKTNATGDIFTNQVAGRIFYDKNNNCRYDGTTETPLVNWLVKAESATKTAWGYTDSLGNYAVFLDSQTYQISLIKPNNYWLPCQDSVFLGLSSGISSVRLDFPVKNTTNCPLLEIDISTPLLRRCFSNNYTVRYCNRGTAAAQNAHIQVKLDNGLTYNSSTRPLSNRQGNTLFFNLGTVESGGCGTFQINATVRCDSTIIGQTHCTEARIYPDSLCLPRMGWSGGNITVAGSCLGDSVQFLIRNTGSGATSAPLSHIVIEDCVVFLQGQVPPLLPNESRTFKVPANGATWRIISQQEINHPNPTSRPTAFVEGCRRTPTLPLSLGFVTEFDEDDGDPFTAIDCHQNIGSYDPNDKQTHPKGIDRDHFITENEELDYTIRFQNTGTDTAFTVVLRDTLSSYLDIATFRTGASSHNYKLDILEGRILKFTFNNINLPDSNRNLAASQGFIKFWVKLKKDVPFGSKIENKAAIYFDFNAPILTNTVFHTLRKTPKYKSQDVTMCQGASYKGVVYYADTKRRDTVRFARFDSIYLTQIRVLPAFSTKKDTAILRGGNLGGIVVRRDTVIILTFKARNFCDSIVTYRVSVLTKTENFNPQNVRLFPNPTTGVFTLELLNGLNADDLTITIVSVLGETVFTQKMGKQQVILNLDTPKGIYFVILTRKDGAKLVQKIIHL